MSPRHGPSGRIRLAWSNADSWISRSFAGAVEVDAL